MDFITRKFELLTNRELYNIYLLRSKVFVLEQNCAYQDVDEKDPAAHHVMMLENDELVGYCRILPPGLSYPEAAIGRVVIDKARRHLGLGTELMKYSMTRTLELFKVQQIVISAQCYLGIFYTDLGFEVEGQEYLEDNIPHIKMRYFSRGAAS